MRSRVDARSETFAANRDAMLTALEELRGLQEQVVAGGGEKAVARHRKRGKLLPRERIELLLDRGLARSSSCRRSPGWGTDDPLGGGVVTGIGVVSAASSA